MEFGNPPLYAEINKAMHSINKSQIENLGPIAQALNSITLSAEHFNEDDDNESTGFNI